MNYVKTSLFVVFLLACASPVLAETITMTTYYPSPSGNYSNLNVTGSLIFTSGGQSYFAGVNGGNFYLNTGVVFNAATGMVIANDGRIAVGKVPNVAGREFDVNGDLGATTITAATSSSLAAATATTLTTTGAISATTAAGTITATGAITGGSFTTAGASSLKAVTATTITTTGDVNVGNAGAGNVTARAFFHWSDERLKEEIVPITDAIQKVKAINGVYFKYKDKKEETRMGLIAQNVEKVVPEVVSTDKDGMKSVDYSSLVALLIEAVKEQQVIIDELQGKKK